LHFSPSNDYIIYDYDITTKYEDRTVGYFSLNNPQKRIYLCLQGEHYVEINPTQDIIYMINSRERTLKVYNLDTSEIIASYDNLNNISDGGRLVMMQLSDDGKLLHINNTAHYFSQQPLWHLINTKTNKVICSGKIEEFASLNGNILKVFKKGKEPDYSNDEFVETAEHKHKLSEVFAITYPDKFENNQISQNNNIKTNNVIRSEQEGNVASLIGGIAITLASLIAIYKYYPEFFKNIFLHFAHK